jgi:hypothetical protein
MDKFDLKKYLVENKATINSKMTEKTSNNLAIEKAKEVIETFGKERALYAVDEILIAIQDLPIDNSIWDYWQQVKKEIEKL